MKNKDDERIKKHIQDANPDILAVFEVEGKQVFQKFMEHFPQYSFHITEGTQTQEILLGVRGNLTSFFTQRTEFKHGNEFLRPGTLLTVRVDIDNDKHEDYTFLFLHTKSKSVAIGLGTREKQFDHAFNLKKKLDEVDPNHDTKFVIVGDLNTMGMKYGDFKITAEDELKFLKSQVSEKDMSFLDKDYGFTYTTKTGKKKTDLDHVVATKNIKFRQWGEKKVKVSGWKEFDEANDKAGLRDFVEKVSDHNSLYFEIIYQD